MDIVGEQVLLRIYLRSADRAPFTPTFQRIVKAARQEGLAGATVIKGILGAGARGVIRPSVWSLTEQAPVIVEIVDRAERISGFVDGALARQMSHGMATLERAKVMMYRSRLAGAAAPIELAGPLPPLSTLPKIKPREDMTINEDGILLRVFIGESDAHESRPLYEAIVEKARELGLAGATVLRGIEGFGAHSVVHRASLLEMSTDLPIVIELVDRQEKMELILPHLQMMVGEGMMTMEYVTILRIGMPTAERQDGGRL